MLSGIVSIQIKLLSRTEPADRIVLWTTLLWVPMSLGPAMTVWEWPQGWTWAWVVPGAQSGVSLSRKAWASCGVVVQTSAACMRMLSTISVLFGGRIAEEVFMNQMTTGASNDFERATHIARDMVMRYGMVKSLGQVAYEEERAPYLGIPVPSARPTPSARRRRKR